MHYSACLNLTEFNQDQTISKELNKHVLKVTISVSYFYLLSMVIPNHLVFQTLQVKGLRDLSSSTHTTSCEDQLLVFEVEWDAVTWIRSQPRTKGNNGRRGIMGVSCELRGG